MRPVGGLPLIHIDKPRSAGATRMAKRLFDVVGASTILLALSPLMLCAALRIKLHDGGPVMFRQARIGQDGEAFGCYKFRTMVVDAERQLASLHSNNERSGPLFKMTNDPRVTRIGRFLRESSLDELPQLFNVFGGSMSLVGPRPQIADEVALYSDGAERRLLSPPGVTGLWQVSGRSSLSWEQAMRLDLYYVENWSLLGDLAILARTARAVLAPGETAH